jgi:hypothetical protein
MRIMEKSPVGACGHVSYTGPRDVPGDKTVHRVTDKNVCILDLLPEKFPDFSLRAPRRFNKIIPHLNVASINNRSLWIHSLGDRDETGHLWVVNDDDIGATIGRPTKRAACA